MAELSLKSREAVESLVKMAGDSILCYWPGSDDSEKLDIQKKHDGSQVTNADLLVHEKIKDGLARLFPNDGLFSEEEEPAADLGKREHVWVLDPIDGTANFIDGRDSFCILLARCVGGKPDYGIVYFPARRTILAGYKSCGTHLNGEQLSREQSVRQKEERIFTRHFKPKLNYGDFNKNIVTAEAVLALCQDEIGGMVVKITKHQEWDLAAYIPVIEGVGGKVTDPLGR